MSKLSDYLEKVEILKREIEGCDGLVDFYKNKKERLLVELDAILNQEVSE